MRNWLTAVSILLSALVCHGEEKAIGPVDFALDEAEKSSVKQYYNVNSGGQSILKIYENGTWKDARVNKDSTGNSVLETRDGNGRWEVKTGVNLASDTYVISHGLNDTYGSGWINKSADAIASKNSDAIILSVNWDHYSGTESNIKDSNFGASSWINSVTPVLADELSKFENIKSFVGHSYGAHLLAATAVTMKKHLSNNKISFVALDPAEETLTFTGDKDGKPTWMWSKDKKSKNWELPSNVESEVYKSSGFLGSEERLGKYNYFLAAEASITPRGVLGDLDPSNKKMDYSDLSAKEKENGLTNHSLAPAWFAEFITKQELGEYEDDNLIGGWFKSDTDMYRGNRKEVYWDGIVNADTSITDPRLEYAARGEKESFTEWQDLCNAEAQSLLYKDQNGNEKADKSNWADTVLKPSAYDTYRGTHGKVASEIKDAVVDTITGGAANIPANILDAVFADDPAEPKDAQTLANEAFYKEVEKIVKDIADGDESLAQKIKDFVKGKIDEMIKKGEDWIENGGIRRTILEQVDKMVEGKVSPEDAQRIHNLVDTLCNVNKDGGESFLNTLGTDGKDLAVSLAIEALKKQLSDALPEDAADMVNALLDVLKENGTAEDYKKAVIGQLQDLITKYVPYENTANTLNNILQNIADGNAIDVMDSIKDVGKNLGIDLLKDAITKNLDPELAAKINALLDGFAANGIQGLTDEALAQINALIDKYAPGSDSAQKIKDIIKGTLNGTVTASDLKDAATSLAVDGAKKLINDSNLPQGVKDAANAAIDELAEDGISGKIGRAHV